MPGIFNWDKAPRNEDGTLQPPSYNTPAPLAGSAQRIHLNNAYQLESFIESRKRTSWQSDAWDFYDIIGELKFASNLIANVLSRINLYVGYVDDTARVPSHIRQSPASEYADICESTLALLEEEDGGTSDLLRVAALNMFVTGEFYLVKVPGDNFNDPPKFQIKSVDEIVIEGMGRDVTVYLKSSADQDRRFWKKLPKENSFAVRMWRKHPRYSQDADSSVRGVLDDCDDLVLYSKEGRSASFSRIPAGLLFIPDSIAHSSRPNSDSDEYSDGTDDNELDIIQDMTNALVDPITDESNIHNSAPYILTGPAESGEKIKYISLQRAYDPMYQTNVEKKLDRILTSLDIPKDIAKGLSNVKYSNGAVIEESLYKLHIEPLALMVVDILTKGFLLPAIKANNVPEDVAKKVVVWYDPSAITAKPSKAEAANFGVQNNIISFSSWRANTGFSEADAPSDQELALKLLFAKMAMPTEMADRMVEYALPGLADGLRQDAFEGMDPASAQALQDVFGGTPTSSGGVPQDTAPDFIEPDVSEEQSDQQP